MEKHKTARKNHAILILPWIIIVILGVAILYQNRRIHELERSDSSILQAGSDSEADPLRGKSYNAKSEKNESAEAGTACQDRIKNLETVIADMQSWQDYLEETLEKENNDIILNEERTYKNYKMSFSNRFKSFMEENNLSPKEREEFIELLVQKQLESTEMYRGRHDWEYYQKESEKIESKYDGLIADLLSSRNYSAYKEYVDSEQDRSIVNSYLANSLTGDNKLSPQQEKNLVAAMYRTRLDIEETEGIRELETAGTRLNENDRLRLVRARKKIYEGYLESAKGILTDSQMKRYERVIDLQISTLEMTEKQISLMRDNLNSEAE